MTQQFNPRSVLRQTSNNLLREFFEKQGHPLPIEWDDISERRIDKLFYAWQALAPDARREIEVGLRDVCDMANDDGIRVIVEESKSKQKDIGAELERWESRHDKALWTLLRHPNVWHSSVLFAQADSLSHGRCWVGRGSMPGTEPKTDPATIVRFRDAVSGFFRERQARGHQCHVDHMKRGSHQDYFFVYLSDYADTYLKLDDQQQIKRIPERRAFEVVFAFDNSTRSLEMYAKGGKPVVQALQEVFSRVILGQEIDASSPDGKAFRLDHLMDRAFGFPTDPADHIANVRLRSLKLAIVGTRRGTITLEPQKDDPTTRIYEMLDEDLNNKRLPKESLRVSKATISMQLNGGTRRKTLTFNITWPNRCDLKSKPDDLRALGEKYLQEWKINVD